MATETNAKTDGQMDLLEGETGNEGAGALRTKLRWTVGELTMLIEFLARGKSPKEIAAFLRRSAEGVRRMIVRLMDESDDQVIGIAGLAETTRATLAEVRRKTKGKQRAATGRSAQDRALHANLLRKMEDVTTSVQNLRAEVESERRVALTCLAIEMAGRSVPTEVFETFPMTAEERDQVQTLADAVGGVETITAARDIAVDGYQPTQPGLRNPPSGESGQSGVVPPPAPANVTRKGP